MDHPVRATSELFCISVASGCPNVISNVSRMSWAGIHMQLGGWQWHGRMIQLKRRTGMIEQLCSQETMSYMYVYTACFLIRQLYVRINNVTIDSSLSSSRHGQVERRQEDCYVGGSVNHSSMSFWVIVPTVANICKPPSLLWWGVCFFHVWITTTVKLFNIWTFNSNFVLS